MIGADEGGTLRTLKAIRKELIDPTIANHYGRPVKTTGDGLLAELAVSVDALRCATEIQAGMAERNVTAPEGERIEFRVGLNVGDIVVEDDDIFGDGVNVAARFEGLAEPGGICVSARVEEVLGPGEAATVAPIVRRQTALVTEVRPEIVAGTDSLWILPWRERDSNPRSHSSGMSACPPPGPGS